MPHTRGDDRENVDLEWSVTLGRPGARKILIMVLSRLYEVRGHTALLLEFSLYFLFYNLFIIL